MEKLIDKYINLFKSDNLICSRKDFNVFLLICIVLNIIIIIIMSILAEFGFSEKLLLPIWGIIGIILDFFIIVLQIKRLHDINNSGLWIFFAPSIFLCIFKKSIIEDNKYIKKMKQNGMIEKTQEEIASDYENEKLEEFIKILENQSKE